MIHELKTWPKYFQAILMGEKKFELRENDRGFEISDILNLREYDPESDLYTGREFNVKVTYIMRDDTQLFELDNHVIMSIKPLRQSIISKLWNKMFDLN